MQCLDAFLTHLRICRRCIKCATSLPFPPHHCSLFKPLLPFLRPQHPLQCPQLSTTPSFCPLLLQRAMGGAVTQEGGRVAQGRPQQRETQLWYIAPPRFRSSTPAYNVPQSRCPLSGPEPALPQRHSPDPAHPCLTARNPCPPADQILWQGNSAAFG